MKMRVIYCENWNDKEGVKIEIDVGNGWEFESFFPLVSKSGADDEKIYLHWRILRKIGEMMSYGYKLTKIDI